RSTWARCSSGRCGSCRWRTSSGSCRWCSATRRRRSRRSTLGRGGAQNLRAGPWRTLRTVTLPLMTRDVLAGALMAFVQGFGEYVASVVVYPARFAPLSVEIYNRQYANELGSAFAYGSLQMLAILVVLIISELLENPRWWRRR